MKSISLWMISIFLLSSCKSNIDVGAKETTKEYSVHTIAFYNLENLYGLEIDPNTRFSNSTVKAEKYYTQEVYNAKQENLSKVIADLGRDFTGTSPTIIGLAEVENFRVLNYLVNRESLIQDNYSIIHYDSPDLRGIDVALLYKKKVFIPTNSKSHKLVIFQDLAKTKRKHTRDLLVVSGILEGEKIHIIVNHWPSRADSQIMGSSNRLKAAELNRHIIDSLFDLDPKAKIINMGDFNDNPTDRSIKKGIVTKGLRKNLKDQEIYNPMEVLYKKGIGSIAWRDSWHLFDQIMLSSELVIGKAETLKFHQAEVYNKPYITTSSGRYKGYPYRSFSYEGWTGGYSDHFPVLIYLIKKKQVSIPPLSPKY